MDFDGTDLMGTGHGFGRAVKNWSLPFSSVALIFCNCALYQLIAAPYPPFSGPKSLTAWSISYKNSILASRR